MTKEDSKHRLRSSRVSPNQHKYQADEECSIKNAILDVITYDREFASKIYRNIVRHDNDKTEVNPEFIYMYVKQMLKQPRRESMTQIGLAASNKEKLDILCDSMWESKEMERLRDEAQGEPSVSDDGYLLAGVSNGASRLILTMASNDYCQILDRTGLRDYGNPLGLYVGMIHANISHFEAQLKEAMYYTAVGVRMAIFIMTRVSGVTVEPNSFITRDWDKYVGMALCLTLRCLSETKIHYAECGLPEIEDLATPYIVASGVVTVNKLALFAAMKVEEDIISLYERRFKEVKYNSTANFREDGTVVIIATCNYTSYLIQGDYWREIITRKGYKLKVGRVVVSFWLCMVVLFALMIWGCSAYQWYWTNKQVDTTSLLSLGILLQGVVVTIFIATYHDDWSWYDMVRGELYVQRWEQLPESYKTPKAISDYVRFIINNHDKAVYMDKDTNCYLFDTARGQLTGPGPVPAIELKRATSVVYSLADGSIMLAAPKPDRSTSTVALRAEQTSQGYYHVVSHVKVDGLFKSANDGVEIGWRDIITQYKQHVTTVGLNSYTICDTVLKEIYESATGVTISKEFSKMYNTLWQELCEFHGAEANSAKPDVVVIMVQTWTPKESSALLKLIRRHGRQEKKKNSVLGINETNTDPKHNEISVFKTREKYHSAKEYEQICSEVPALSARKIGRTTIEVHKEFWLPDSGAKALILGLEWLGKKNCKIKL